jgi:iron uptake system component EfeO
VARTDAPSGTVTFSVRNTGDAVTEFYLLAEDGLRVISEIENIGPGLTRDLVVRVRPGSYLTACKPGMVGDGIRAAFTVTDSGTAIEPTGDVAQQLADAEAAYLAYVKDQAGALISGTEEFAAAYAAGDDDTARALYPAVRVHWERIEPVAESFGDLDPLLDAREADLAVGDVWSGWHYIEKDLWPPAAEANGGTAYRPLTPAEREAAAADLVMLTGRLLDQVTAPDFTFEAFQIGNGAKELLDEVASGKVTGEEEIWSHTDLWDFAANVDGAWVAFEVLREIAGGENPELVATLDERFEALRTLLAGHGSIDAGFASYDDLSAAEIQALAAAVDALSEPLSQLTATVVGAS